MARGGETPALVWLWGACPLAPRHITRILRAQSKGCRSAENRAARIRCHHAIGQDRDGRAWLAGEMPATAGGAGTGGSGKQCAGRGCGAGGFWGGKGGGL